MNDTHQTHELPEGEPRGDSAGQRPRQLRRSRTDRVLGGVAGGLGEYFRVDPIIFRIGFAVFTLFGGLGALAYLAALLFVPAELGPPGVGERDEWWTPVRMGAVLAIGVAALWALLGGIWWFDGAFLGIFTLAVVAGLVLAIYLLVREPGGILRGLVIAALVLVLASLGIVLAAISALATAAGWGLAVGAVALVIAIGLVAVAFAGPPAGRWLVVPGLLVVVPMAVVLAAGIEIEGGVGSETHRPVSAQAMPDEGYRMAIGELRLDLRNLDWQRGEVVEVDAEIGIGAIEVAVPDEVCVESELETRIGAVGVREGDSAGIGVDYADAPPPGRGPRLVVRGSVGVGAIWVHSALGRERHHRGGWFGDRYQGPTNAEACAAGGARSSAGPATSAAAGQGNGEG